MRNADNHIYTVHLEYINLKSNVAESISRTMGAFKIGKMKLNCCFVWKGILNEGILCVE